MAKTVALKSEKRQVLGRKVKALRKEGKLPANIFGKKIKSQAITLDLQDFQKIYAQVGETSLVEISIKGEKKPRPSLISNVQIHPVTDLPIHADFHQVDLTEKVTANVPVLVVGESPAVKDKAAVLITLFDEIEVEALPTDLPDKFEVDISTLKEFNESVTAKDLKVDRSKVEVKVGENEAIVMVQEPKEEEEEAPPVEEPAEGEEPTEGEEDKSEEEEKEGDKDLPAEASAKVGAKPEETKPEEKPTKKEEETKGKDQKPSKGKQEKK